MTSPFLTELEHINQHILHMSDLAQDALRKMGDALLQGNSTVALEVIEEDREIDKLEDIIEEESVRVLALFQPVADDLRFVVTAMRVIHEVERIGDHAKSNCKRVVKLSSRKKIEVPDELRIAVHTAQSMVADSLDALKTHDTSEAQSVRERDDIVDDACKSLNKFLKKQMHENEENIDCCVYWLAIVKNIERIADLSTNIAKDVIFMVDGVLIKHKE